MFYFSIFNVIHQLNNIKQLFNIECAWVEKGYKTLGAEWGNSNTLDDSFPTSPVTIFHLFETSLSYWLNYGIIKAGWSNLDLI